jgi:hypothetical protein
MIVRIVMAAAVVALCLPATAAARTWEIEKGSVAAEVSLGADGAPALAVTDGGDGMNDDHGDWASAHLVLAR